MQTYTNHADALFRLQQLSAIFKPIMKSHGLQVNHLMEFEPNNEFAGRNWNAGENIEMVLRRRDDPSKFLPFGLICAVFAHELAHNVHMNHVPRLHGALTRQLTKEWKELQRKGYRGDGFWSGGKRLGDEAWSTGDAQGVGDGLFPDALCGGARRRKAARRPGVKRKRKTTGNSSTTTRHKKGQPSLHTGAQTAANTSRTAGKRRAVELPGQGSRIDGRNHIPTATAKSQDYKLDENSTFRKRATTNAARDLRAAAALKRMHAMKTDPEGDAAGVKQQDEETKKPLQGRQQRSIGDWMVREDAKKGAGASAETNLPSDPSASSDVGSPTESEGEADSQTEDDEESETEEEDIPEEVPDDPQAKRQLGLEWDGLLSQVKCGSTSGYAGERIDVGHDGKGDNDDDDDDDIVFVSANTQRPVKGEGST